MDELKHRAGEKLEALHIAAVTVAGNGKSRVQNVYNQTAEAIQKVREIFHDIWDNELMLEGRARVAQWSRDTVQRIREGAPPLSPIQLYEELVELFHDRVWRRSMFVFMCGVCAGGAAGVALGLRARGAAAPGPRARALHAQPDHSVLAVDDHAVPALGPGEVLVRVQALAVTPNDRCALRGRGAALRALTHHTHLTVGRGFAGVVLDVGHGVTDLELGDEVWGCVSEWSGGAAAELLTIRSTRVGKRPTSLSADSAASLPWSGAAALQALDCAKCSPDTCKGKRVAVCGAASGEGVVLVQLLSAWGAFVIAAAPRHAANTLRQLGASELLESEGSSEWSALRERCARAGRCDALLTCLTPPNDTRAIIKATAPRGAVVDLRPRPLITDRLPVPVNIVFAATFYTYRLLRWLVGCGTHTDWLEERYKLREGLDTLAQLVESAQLVPVLDKVYLPQEFESALAHACSEDAVGTTVVRFP